MERFEQLLQDNKIWAAEKIQVDKEFFNRLVNIQKPDFLWIGCSDSRVPPTEITRTQPGEVFIHRNIANMVVHTDINMLSVLQYAVDVLKVKDVIVCGHYGCGGVKAAMSGLSYGIIDKWLRNIKDVYRFNQAEIDAQGTEDARINRLIELNVKEQVHNVAKTTIIQRAWKREQLPNIHGWVYDLADGIIKPLLTFKPNDKLDHAVYEYTNL